MNSSNDLPFRDPEFVPPRCPYPGCAAHRPAPEYVFRRRGSFVRRLDGARVQRFECATCQRSFSSQTFRLDYRLRRPDTLGPIFSALSSKTTLRKTARNLGLGREHVSRRMRLLSRHARDYHAHRLELAAQGRPIGTAFQFDELETYEEHRKLKPVTVCVLVEQRTGFVVSCDAETLAPRKPLNSREKRQLERMRATEGERRSGSLRAVVRTVDILARVAGRERIRVTTDKKSSYARALRRRFGSRVDHVRIDGRAERGTKSPLFPINHTLARLRDLVSRLVRQTWAGAKKRAALAAHLDVTIAFRNYIDGWRSEPAVRRRTSAAAEIGVTSRRLSACEFLWWRDPLIAPA